MQVTLWGLALGIISSISLPLGSVVALWKDPGEKVCAFLMAYGGGALLFALTLELFAEAVNEESIPNSKIMIVVCPAAIAGGLLFIVINRFVNNWGSFLRKFSTKAQYVASLPAKIRSVFVNIVDQEPFEWTRLIGGEKPLKKSNSAESVTSTTSDKIPSLSVEGYDRAPVGSSASGNLPRDVSHLNLKAHTHGQVGLAIWVGILIDGIPESIIIGILAGSNRGTSHSIAFILGVFLSNFPEALSSSLEMKRQGMPNLRIFLMWASLCLITGLGAMVAAAVFPRGEDLSEGYILLNMGIEGVAAGAMLTVIAQTMMPEAFAQGGDLTGIATLLGFLSSLTVKLLSIQYLDN